MLATFMYEIMNTLVLVGRPDIYLTIISYITVTLLADVGRVYYASIKNDKQNILHDVFDEDSRPRVINRRMDANHWTRRSTNNKFQRLLFKFLRGIYIACCFYFVPFLYLFIHQIIFVFI